MTSTMNAMSQDVTAIDAAAAAIGLMIEPAWRADVTVNIAVLLRFGRDVASFPLPDETEPAPVFTAGA